MVRCLFADLGSPRVRFLFKALIRLLIKYEVEGARRLEQVFEQNSKA